MIQSIRIIFSHLFVVVGVVLLFGGGGWLGLTAIPAVYMVGTAILGPSWLAADATGALLGPWMWGIAGPAALSGWALLWWGRSIDDDYHDQKRRMRGA